MGQLGRTQKSQAAASEKKLKAYACELEQKLEARTRELAEARGHLSGALEQQTATAEVLRVISSSPGDLDAIFKAILANATRLCDANFGILYQCDGDVFQPVALQDAVPAYGDYLRREPPRADPRHGLGRLFQTKQPI